MRTVVPMLVIFALSGCKGSVQQPTSLHDQRQAALNQIADKCGLPRTALELFGDDELRFQPPSTANYESVECALREVPKADLHVRMGFVGNEYYAENEQ
jgi:hypothetical protein